MSLTNEPVSTSLKVIVVSALMTRERIDSCFQRLGAWLKGDGRPALF